MGLSRSWNNMPEKNGKFDCVLVSKKKEAEGVITLKFKPKKTGKISFIPGQFVIVHLKNRSGLKGKPYTISSIPSDKFLSITVKKIGEFSTALHNLMIGASVIIDGPMGQFFPEEKNGELVFLAAGIGAAPFFSIIRNYAERGHLKNKKIHLFYSNKTKKDIAFFDELNSISDKNKNPRIFYYLTRQKIKDGRIEEFKRIDAKSIKNKLGRLEDKDYFICGSADFVSDIRRAILDEGVEKQNVHVEPFY